MAASLLALAVTGQRLDFGLHGASIELMPHASPAPATPHAEAPCPNCATVLPASARFCCECGQRQQARVPTLPTWFAEWMEEGFGLNARIPRTLRALLFRPGFLTREWFAGRRTRYISAFRLYLLCSLVMFGTAIGLRFVGDHWNIGYRPQGALADDAYAQLARESATHALFLLVPLSAVWLSWLFRASGRVFIEHLVFSLHVHAFGFIAAAASYLMVFAPAASVIFLQASFALAVLAHLVLALRHVYQAKLGVALAKGVFVFLLHGAAVIALTLSLTELRY